jgi:hypothetical protein
MNAESTARASRVVLTVRRSARALVACGFSRVSAAPDRHLPSLMALISSSASKF